ncbi:hypothetical protein GCM10023329_40710 [Streptomyces sanyensis]|uniref:Uncharacterized protein n=1 Tax=Streptomyces sanyensis TaxID=568869 RepID=A0ABP9AT30_9ACTN
MKPAEEDRPKGWRSRTAGRLPDTHPAPYRQGEPETPFRRAKRHGLLVFALTDARGRLIRVSGARPRRTSEISLPSVAVFPSGPAGRRIEVFNLGTGGRSHGEERGVVPYEGSAGTVTDIRAGRGSLAAREMGTSYRDGHWIPAHLGLRGRFRHR